LIVHYYGVEILTLRKVNQKYLVSFEMRYWRRMEISWTYRVKKGVFHIIKEGRNFLGTVQEGRL
jgi:hypothetical protein